MRRIAAMLVALSLAIAVTAGGASAAPKSQRAHGSPATGGSAVVGGICGFWGPRYIIPGCPR
jgi:hypothetical protein